MAWGIPLTAVASTALTAAQWNASVRDNMLETPAAKATTAGGYFVATGPNAIVERLAAQAIVDVSESTGSTSYTSLGTDGPTLTAVTGTQAIVFTTAQMSNSTTGSTYSSFEVSGATTVAAADTRAVIYDGNGAGPNSRITTATLQVLTAGSNTFRMLYRASSGTGSFNRRRILVMPL